MAGWGPSRWGYIESYHRAQLRAGGCNGSMEGQHDPDIHRWEGITVVFASCRLWREARCGVWRAGSEPPTSPRPPTLINGSASETMNRTRRGCGKSIFCSCRRVKCRRGMRPSPCFTCPADRSHSYWDGYSIILHDYGITLTLHPWALLPTSS
jgi:hypothetical protein